MHRIFSCLTMALALGASPLAIAQDASVPSPSTDATISSGLICSTQDELTKMLDGIALGTQTGLVDGCGMLTNVAHVKATKVGEYHNTGIDGFIFKYETPSNGDVEYGIQHTDTPIPSGPTA